MSAAKSEQKNPIQVIARMLKLLDVLAGHPEPLGLKQVAQYTGLHPSTAHRILSAMAADRLIDRIEPGSYRLGMRLLELGNLVKMRINVREMALPVLREYAKRTGLVAHTRNTLTSLPLLERELERIQRQGWATDAEEAELGVRCVAAAVRDDAGQLIAALSISSPADRMKPTWGPLVKESAERIAHAIGHRKDASRISAA